MIKQINALVIGVLFGVILIKSEVADWNRVQAMFRFEEFHMYGVILSAIAVGALSIWLIRRLDAHTVTDEPITFKPKPFQKGVIIGGTLFGIGWAITGACPGPIYAQIGSGEWAALVTFIGAFGGMYLYGATQQMLPH